MLDFTQTLGPDLPLIHPTCVVKNCAFGSYVELGDHCIVEETAFGDYTYLFGSNDVIFATLGKFNSIATGVRINPVNHPMRERVAAHHLTYRAAHYGLGEDDPSIIQWRRARPVLTGNDVWIGHNAVILGGVTLGDGAVVGARAAYIGGVHGTACAVSDQLYGVPAVGTMAHSWVQMFPTQYDAFKTYCEIYPTNAVLLVDTYNTLKSGVPDAIRAFNEVLKPQGITKCGIRLDSGDIAYLTKEARKMLDEAGWETCTISASNSLDEILIRDLLLQGAKIDSFGVGERLITARSEPVFGGVYKLTAVEEADGSITPKIKISENVAKITTPHFKKLFRFYGNDTGKAIADYLTIHDETVDDSGSLTIFDPEATWKRKEVYDFTAKELQVPVFQAGELVYDLPSLPAIRDYCREQVDTLWDEVKRFDNPHKYYVDLSQKLWDVKHNLLEDMSR